MVQRFARRILIAFLFAAVLGSAIWGAFALWFQLPLPEALRIGATVLFEILAA